MDNGLPQTPENKLSNLTEGSKPIEQSDSLPIKTEEAELGVKQEQPPASQPVSTLTPTLTPTSTPTPTPTPTPTQPQIQPAEEEGNKVDSKDLPWVKKAETIILKDKEKPYQEEEDSEKLQQEYLAKNYGVKVEIDDNQPPKQ